MRKIWTFYLAACFGITGAATHYVAPTGSDAAPGTSARPFRTLARAAGAAAPGDTIVLRDGVYVMGDSSGTGYAVTIRTAGLPDAWITVRAEHKGRAILDCRDICAGHLNFDTGAAYWRIEGLVFEGAAAISILMNSIPAAHDLMFKGNEIRSVARHYTDSQLGMDGVYAGEGHYNLTFDGNVFHHIGRTGPRHMQAHDHGLYLHSSGTTIVNNIFYAPISGWGIQTASGFSGLIANNTFAFPMSSQRGQLTLWGENGAVTIRNNIFYAAVQTAVHIWDFKSSACVIDHNLIHGAVTVTDGTGCKVAANSNGDPRFENAVRAPYDFHLRPGSPAIGAGIPVPAAASDFDGEPRPGQAGFDAGAYRRPAVNEPRAAVAGRGRTRD